ncbi:CaiB/BaiF CoA transferase family protein [Geoglobus ahangari]
MLEGMLVVELAYYYPGPYCCKILSELGANVIKVEPPSGDPMRYREDIYLGMNAGKEVRVLDLKKSEDRKKLYEIVEDADVFVEGFRPGVAERLGVDYKTLKEINDGLIYCSITGFGQKSEMKRPVHDINILSLSGVCEVSGLLRNMPSDPNVQLSDFASAVTAVIAILSAYIRKLKTGKGAYIDVSMYDSALFAIPLHFLNTANGNEHLTEFYSNPGYKIYRARDCYVSLGILDEPKFWKILCERLGLGEYGDVSFVERLRRSNEIERKISEKISELRKTDLESIFKEDIPYGIVNDLKSVSTQSRLVRRTLFMDRDVKTVSFPAIFHLD